MEIEKVLDEIKQQEKEGNVVFLTFEGFMCARLEDFVKQPADGILYDLNRDRVTTITLAEAGKLDKRWVNDYAVAVVIKYLREQISALQKESEE